MSIVALKQEEVFVVSGGIGNLTMAGIFAAAGLALNYLIPYLVPSSGQNNSMSKEIVSSSGGVDVVPNAIAQESPKVLETSAKAKKKGPPHLWEHIPWAHDYNWA